MLYPTLKFLCKTACQCYFSKIEFNGLENIPKGDVPVVYTSNHHSAFLDAILLAVFSDTPIYFLARADVFSGALGKFLEAINMMPIYRQVDGYKNLSRNEAIFSKCNKLLKEKKRILIFPEGSQSELFYLRPLTKGIARIALNTQAEMSEDLYVMPMGLTYFNQYNSGRKVVMSFGKPIIAKDYMASYKENNNKAYRAILEKISDGIKEQLIIPELTDDYPIQTQSLNRTNEKYPFAEIREKFSNGDYNKTSKKYPALKLLKWLLFLPNLPIMLVMLFILGKLTTNPLFIASMKVAFAALLFPVWLLICFLITSLIFGLAWAAAILGIQVLSLYMIPKVSRFIY